MLSLAPITIFTDGAHTIDYLPNCVFWTNTIGKIKRSFDLMGPNGPSPHGVVYTLQTQDFVPFLPFLNECCTTPM